MEQIIITKPNGSTYPLASKRTATEIKSAKQSWALLADDVVSISIESPFPQTYGIGDHFTVFGRAYKLNRLPKVKKTGMHAFSYDLEFEGIQYDLIRATYDLTIDTTNNQLQDVQADTLTGNLRRFSTVLISNANRVFPNTWVLGSCPDTIEDKTLTFGEGDNCLSVLQTLCTEFGVEFEIVQSNGKFTINFVSKVGQIFPFTFEFGKGKGLYSLDRQNVDSSNIITRLKVYGSTSNITNKYRASRLCLPGKSKAQSYIEKPEAVAKYGIYESTKYFDDIKPTFNGSITGLVSGSVLKFIDTKMFDLNALEADGKTTKYLIEGCAAKVHFNTGNLSGYEFEVHAYDHATKTFTLVKQTDDRGDVFPSESSSAFQFAQGNEYKLLDIALPDIPYQNDAENKLNEQGNIYYDQNSQPKVQYGLSVTKAYLKTLVGNGTTVNIFAPGDYIPVKDSDIDVDKSVRIKSLTRNLLDEYEYTLTISDTVSTNITNRVISELVDIDKIITINNLKDPVRARANWRSSREVLNMVFDPEGDYYTDKIKPNSIDTLALSVGAKSMQFGLTNTVLQPNFNGNKNTIKVKGGVLTHYTINEESARSWVLADNTTTFPKDTQAYYIYAKCAKVGEAGSIIFSTEQIKVEQDAMFYHFWIGVVNSVDAELKARSVALSYGFTMINGRFIKTGRIESADGLTYFDLDNSEIGGRIVFTSNGQEKTLDELGRESLESKDYIKNTLPGILSEIQAQLDGQIEQFFETYDPATTNAPANTWTTTQLKEEHLGDLFYNTDNGKVFRWVKNGSVYSWQQLQDSEVAQALALANDALALAKTKRRIFTATPYPPYEVGDLWVNGMDLRRCSTSKAIGQPYSINDWVVAVNYDNTKTVIDGGLVTSGTIQVAGSTQSILAGMTGQGTTASSIRFWAGASFENRTTAPYRVMQDGSVVMTKATVEGIIKAISGTIGGFEIGQGRIGVSESDASGSYNGLSILSSLIKYSDARCWTGIGTNVFPSSSGLKCIARHELDYDGIDYASGIALYTRAKFPNDGMDSWYTRRSIWNEGNMFSVGGHCLFDDKYNGQAYTDILESYIGVSHSFVFTSIGSSYLNVRLPSKSYIDNKTGNRPVSFLLQIQIGWLGNGNRIKVSGVYQGYLVDNNGNRPNGGNGWVDMAQGDSLVLRYHNGDYYMVQYRT